MPYVQLDGSCEGDEQGMAFHFPSCRYIFLSDNRVVMSPEEGVRHLGDTIKGTHADRVSGDIQYSN